MRRLFLFLAAAALASAARAAWKDALDPSPAGMSFLGRKAPGALSLRAEPSSFSPNDDGHADAAFFSLGTEGLTETARWRTTVRNAKGKTVRVFEGRGAPPGLLEWDGKDAKGRVVAEGLYDAQAQVTTPEGRVTSAAAAVTVDLTPPALTLAVSSPVFSPDGDNAGETLRFSFDATDKNPLTRWTLTVLTNAESPRTVHTASGAFEGAPLSAEWDGRGAATGEVVSNGAYFALFVAQDAAANSPAPVRVDFEVRASTAAVVKSLMTSLAMEAVPGGYRVVLDSAKIFDTPAGTRVRGDPRGPAANLLALAKTFPDHRVLLDGFAGTGATAAERANLSSAQAWALFSYLVRAGVPAPRVEVHGRGGRRGTSNHIDVRLLAPAAAPAAVPALDKGAAPSIAP